MALAGDLDAAGVLDPLVRGQLEGPSITLSAMKWSWAVPSVFLAAFMPYSTFWTWQRRTTIRAES